jgi:hypothetical protein
MSSATSIDRKGSVSLEAGEPRPQPDATFKPSHFFVLASLILATAAVVMARQSTPANLVLISLTIGAAGAAAAGCYRMLAPLAMKDLSAFRERPSVRARNALEREKTLVLRSIKELEFDRAMGKVSPRDFDEMAGRLRARALMLMKQLDEGGTAYREIIERDLKARLLKSTAPTGTLPAGLSAAAGQDQRAKAEGGSHGGSTCICGTANDADAAFCKRCGTKLVAVP